MNSGIGDDGEKKEMSKTGLFNLAKEAPVRPVTSMWLIVFGTITILMALVAVFGAYIKNYTAATCAGSAAILVMWFSIAFLWHSVRQLAGKIEALTEVTERVRKQVDHLDTLVR
jgi:hypothetical protein